MFSYTTAKKDEATFLSLTSLTVSEFDILCIQFAEKWIEITKDDLKDAANGGRPPGIKTIEDRLLFILFYLKTYPLQEVIGYCFGISQETANQQIHLLSNVLSKTLKKMGHAPPRVSEEMLKKLEIECYQTQIIDATERPINRPINPEGQKHFYSGKKNAIQ